LALLTSRGVIVRRHSSRDQARTRRPARHRGCPARARERLHALPSGSPAHGRVARFNGVRLRWIRRSALDQAHRINRSIRSSEFSLFRYGESGETLHTQVTIPAQAASGFSWMGRRYRELQHASSGVGHLSTTKQADPRRSHIL